MRTFIAAVVILGFFGCGSNDSDETPGFKDASSGADAIPIGSKDVRQIDPLLGTWIDAPSTGVVIQAKFTGSTFELDLLSDLSDGSIGLQIDSGTYSVSESSAEVKLTASSCQGFKPITEPTKIWTFTRQGNSLSLNTGTTMLVFQLATDPPSGMGIAKIGCFASDGTFTAHAITPIP